MDQPNTLSMSKRMAICHTTFGGYCRKLYGKLANGQPLINSVCILPVYFFYQPGMCEASTQLIPDGGNSAGSTINYKQTSMFYAFTQENYSGFRYFLHLVPTFTAVRKLF